MHSASEADIFDGTVSSEIIGSLFGLSNPQISNLVTKGVLVKKSRDSFFFAKSIRGYIEHLRNSNDQTSDEFTRAKIKLTNAKTLNERMKYEKDAANLVPVQRFRDTIADLLKMVEQRLENAPDVVDRDVGLSDAQYIAMKDAIDSIRLALAKSLEIYGAKDA